MDKARLRTIRTVSLVAIGLAGLVAGYVLSWPVVVGLGAALFAVGLTIAVLAGPVSRAASDPVPTPESETPAEVAVARVPATLDPHIVLASLADAVRHIADPVGTSLWLADDSSATLRQIAGFGPMAPSAQPIPLDDDRVMARAHAEGTAEMEEIARLRGASGNDALWRFAIPVLAGEHQGVAAIDFRATGRPDPTDLPVATAPLRGALAGTLALYVARAELETAHALVDAARALSRILDPQEVLSTALTTAMEISGAATGSVMLLDPDSGRLVITISRGLPEEVVRSTSLGEGEGIAGWVLATRQPLLVEDLPARTPAARRHGIRSAVSVPIADDDGVLGVLNVGSRSFPARFGDSHMRTIEMLGRQTATALRNARAVTESRELYFDTLKALALALETKDPYSRGGTDRVLACADALGAAFSLTDQEREALRIAALLHDIGMASVGDAVAEGDRTLTTVERALLKLHPQIAADILTEAPALRHVVPIVYHHHEWFDGAGYLNGLAGESIPIGARILAVADAYVAMTSDRPYRRAFTPAEALREVEDKAGTQFDPAVVDALRDILRDGSNRVPS
ncbi:MAG: GAF domain-containing protein [Coriobacteriia bacterium]|nr:GAF domain-containing protein [Coriobacteriia bacterium]